MSQTQMEWVIIRPGGLQSEDATNDGVLTESTDVCGAITRADVAKLVVKACFSDNANGKVLAAIDSKKLMTTDVKYSPAQL